MFDVATLIPPHASREIGFDGIEPTEVWDVRSLDDRFYGLAANISNQWVVVCLGGFCPVCFAESNKAIAWAALVGSLEIVLERTPETYPEEEGL